MQSTNERTSTVWLWLGVFWTVTGNMERIIGWISGAISRNTENAVSNVENFFAGLWLVGDDTSQKVMTAGGVMMFSIGVVLFIVHRRVIQSLWQSLVGKRRVNKKNNEPPESVTLPGGITAKVCQFELPQDFLDMTVFQSAEVPLALLGTGLGGRVIGRSFYNCVISGPAVLMLMNNTKLDESCRLDTGRVGPDAFFLKTYKRQKEVSGVIGMDNCTFAGCTFKLIGFVGPIEELDKLKEMLTGG